MEFDALTELCRGLYSLLPQQKNVVFMVRFLSWLITLPVFLVLVSFALANRQDVTLSFWPFDAELILPLSILVLGFMFSGIILGSFIVWFGGIPRRLRARSQKRELTAAQKQIEMLQEKLSSIPVAAEDDFAHNAPRKRLSGF